MNDVVLTIRTKNEAQCRYDDSDKSYSLMKNRFDSDENSKLHLKRMPVDNQRNYKFYIRCRARFFQVSPDATIVEFTTIGTIDFTPPVIKVLSPMGQLPATTTEVELAVDTNEKSVCRYDEKDVAFEQMSKYLASNSLGMTHKASMRVEAAKKYEFFISCQDVKGNTNLNSSTISFEILPAGSADAIDPVDEPPYSGTWGQGAGVDLVGGRALNVGNDASVVKMTNGKAKLLLGKPKNV